MNKILTFSRVLNRRNAVFLKCKQLLWDAGARGNTLCSISSGSLAPPPPKTVLKPAVIINGTSVDDDRTLQNFMSIFPSVVGDLMNVIRILDVPDATAQLVKSLMYNVPNGKKNRGLAVVLSYKMLYSGSELDEENLKLSYILGWCVEIFQAFLLVMDDIMDNSITRRGRPCWYRHNDMGLIAINDAILLEQAIYQLVKMYFGNQPYYSHILDLFHDVTMKSAMGQSLDMLTANSFKFTKLEKYTMENYTAIVKYKTAYYSFFLPVCLAMRATNINDPAIFRQAKTIMIEMGHFFQVQDDFLDCYGDPNVMGKIGTDIEDGKCSWLAVVALQKANSQQKKIMEENYGIANPTNVAIIKDLYEQLEIPDTFHHYEKENYKLMCYYIQNVNRASLQDLFFTLLEKIYKRKL